MTKKIVLTLRTDREVLNPGVVKPVRLPTPRLPLGRARSEEAARTETTYDTPGPAIEDATDRVTVVDSTPSRLP